MFRYLLLFLAILPILEIYTLLKVGPYLGAFKTLVLLVTSGVVGATLARIQGLLVAQKMQESLNRGLMPAQELVDGFLLLVAGILFIIPGFLSDIVAIFLLIPWTRMLIKFILKKKFATMIKSDQTVQITTFDKKNTQYDDIDIN